MSVLCYNQLIPGFKDFSSSFKRKRILSGISRDILIWMDYFKNCFVSRIIFTVLLSLEDFDGVLKGPHEICLAYWKNYFQQWRKLWRWAISDVACSVSYLIGHKFRHIFKETLYLLCSCSNEVELTLNSLNPRQFCDITRVVLMNNLISKKIK